MRKLQLVLPLFAVVTLGPILFGDWTCGVDSPFHLQSWIEAAHQLRHGGLYPRWTFAAAYNSGEPRFTFYPPLSWELGGLLTLLLPISIAPKLFLWIVLSLAGFTTFRMVRPFTSATEAVLCGCVYLGNPYMLYTVVRRAAFGELLAAAWCPLLIAAMLVDEPSAWSIGVPLALMWLSDVPAAVLATYLLVLLALIRLVLAWWVLRQERSEDRARALLRLGGIFSGGLAFGLALPAIFLVPALWERDLIRMEDAFSPGMRTFDNLLLLRRLDPVADQPLIHIEHIALGLGVATALTLGVGWRRARREPRRGLREAVLWPVSVVSSVSIFMLLAPAAPLWRTLPALWVAQLPWRSLFILACCLSVAVAVALNGLRLHRTCAVLLSLAFVAISGAAADRSFHRTCDAAHRPAAIQAALEQHHTPEPTDEYVSVDADAEYMRPDNPPFWLAQDPQAYAPGTTRNTTHADPTALMPTAPASARLSATPLRFRVESAQPAYLVVNLQNFPKWRVKCNGQAVRNFLPRPDGLIAFQVPPGESAISITWHHGADEWAGGLLSAVALLIGLNRRRWLRAIRAQGVWTNGLRDVLRQHARTMFRDGRSLPETRRAAATRDVPWSRR